MRMRQEIILGVGGVKALSALGIQPDVFHMNEGHSAVLALERIRLNLVEKKLNFYSALQVVAGSECFYHTHASSRRQRFLLAGDDAKIFREIRKGLNIPFDELFSFGHTRLNPTSRSV